MRTRTNRLKVALMALMLGTLPATFQCDTYNGIADVWYDVYPGGWGYDYDYGYDVYYDDYYYDDYYYDDYYYYEEDSWWW